MIKHVYLLKLKREQKLNSCSLYFTIYMDDNTHIYNYSCYLLLAHRSDYRQVS